MDDIKAKRLRKEALDRAERGVGKAVKRVVTAASRVTKGSAPRSSARKSTAGSKTKGKRTPSVKQLQKKALAVNKALVKAEKREEKKASKKKS